MLFPYLYVICVCLVQNARPLVCCIAFLVAITIHVQSICYAVCSVCMYTRVNEGHHLRDEAYHGETARSAKKIYANQDELRSPASRP